MPDNIHVRSTVRIFADDTIMYLAITSDVDTVHLQEELDKLASWELAWMMSFHPEKCNVLTVSRKRNIIKRGYILHGHQLEQVTSAKYLGVTISSDLRWNVHIANICKRANSTLSFLKRNINISNPKVKENAYEALVRPTMEYACTTWDPYQQNNRHSLEMVQRRAARYVRNRYHNTSSVIEMLHQLQWTSLEDRRRQARLMLLYKISNNLVKIDPTSKLIPPKHLSRNMHDRSFQIPASSTTLRRESFYPRTIREWNSLPASVATAGSLETFKVLIRQLE
jgi:hypothetical protein